MSKAGRPKKGSEGLPGWFDIEKYRIVKSYDAAAWFQQLTFRGILDYFGAPEIGWPYQAEWLALIKTDPHVTMARIETARFPESGETPDLRPPLPYKTYMIAEMTISAHWGYGVRTVTKGDKL